MESVFVCFVLRAIFFCLTNVIAKLPITTTIESNIIEINVVIGDKAIGNF